ncbi:MAG: sulfatase-like hydrolase/transferase [Planctomycetota bacterium]|nr:sulfatase-like hydrolase/transferase [Planctomycetota bacterium]
MSKRPNILLITSDQQHWNTLGCINPKIKTPALDRLAREGTRFDRAYCNNPVCSPSRSTIITGQYPSWHHCWTIGVKLPEDVPTVGETFTRHGYDTTLVGKAHFQPLVNTPGSESIESQPLMRDLDYWRKFQGPWYGFGRVETARMHGDESHAGQHYGIWMEEKGLKNWRDFFWPWPHSKEMKRRYGAWDLPAEYHYSTWTAERTIANIERNANSGQPFFLWSSFHDPHPPYVVPEPWASMYKPEDMDPGAHTPGEFEHMPPHFRKTQEKNPDYSMYQETRHGNHGFHSHLTDEATLRKNMAIYYGMTSFMDQQIGRVLDSLDRLGIADNTVVVFSTDHGHFLGQHGLTAKGAFHYEDLLRLPFLVRWPGQVPAGRTSSALQALIDLPETFLSAAGIPVPGQMQGVNQLDVWRGEKESARDGVIVEFRHQPTKVHLRTYVGRRYKMTLYRDHDYGELFDLEEDPGELRNRWDDPAFARVKAEVMHRFLNEEIRREPTRMPRVAGA